MVRRFYFLAIALFWVIMNVLLWRSEMSGTATVGSAVPMDVIWQKILSAPDDSALEIMREGRKIGYCRWRPSINEGPSGLPGQANAPEGQVKRLAGYTIDLEGNVTWADLGNVRFGFHGEFGPDHRWRRLIVRGSARPWSWELRAVEGADGVTVMVEGEEQKWERQLSYAELRNPAGLFSELGIPVPPLLLMARPHIPVQPNLSASALGMKWEAHLDWFQLGHSPVRVYRVKASVLESYRANLVVSRVGELLKIELPGGITLINDALSPF